MNKKHKEAFRELRAWCEKHGAFIAGSQNHVWSGNVAIEFHCEENGLDTYEIETFSDRTHVIENINFMGLDESKED